MFILYMLRAFLKLVGFLLLTFFLIPFQVAILSVTKGSASYYLPRLWHQMMCKISGLKLRIHGIPVQGQAVYVANHISYLDIPVLGSLVKASFAAKNDVASWPLFGFLSKIQQTAFISRKKNDARLVSQSLKVMMKQGKSLILFPEGTSTTGENTLPFRSSLFNLHEDDQSPPTVFIQPVTLRLQSVNGYDVNRYPDARLGYAWVGDMVLVPHLWMFWMGSGACIDVIFHPPLLPTIQQDRKELAQLAWTKVSSSLAQNGD